ncbi:hypothetical protein [Curtobacterium aetherium]|uniref:Uncharacterized protein n=1 Tax=Curtobacterium aetherium TaxID=2841594 RepID=A0ACD1E1J5_9MICO|nr:hypothetical protein [Curtobacterium sp. L6-1]QWS32793.1 hypothetical protein KM842_10970 [Curtobacterium sp. L6-1]
MNDTTTPRTTRTARTTAGAAAARGTAARGTIASVAGALVLVVALAGCSEAPDSSSPAAAAGTGIGAKWGACMRAAGFDVEDPSDALVESGAAQFPSGVDEEKATEAGSKCAEEIGVERTDSAEQDKWTRQYEQVASCIREEYEDYPEQSPGMLMLSPDQYPRASEQGFVDRSQECLQEFAPDTKTMSR